MFNPNYSVPEEDKFKITKIIKIGIASLEF